jgi:hypothetical protein
MFQDQHLNPPINIRGSGAEPGAVAPDAEFNWIGADRRGNL